MREAAVVGVPDDVRGEVPIAYIVADDALDVAELEATCRAQLASFKIPRAFVRRRRAAAHGARQSAEASAATVEPERTR